MIKYWAIYTSEDASGRWPESFVVDQERVFQTRVKHGTVCLEDGSDEDQCFRTALNVQRIDFIRTTFRAVSGKHVDSEPYFFLRVKEDKYYERDCIFDYSTKCEGGDGVWCTRGIVQSRKPSVDINRSRKVDFMGAYQSIRPRIYVVSTRVRRAFEEANISGIEFMPCLDANEDYAEADAAFGASEMSREGLDGHHQLIVQQTVDAPLRVGTISRIGNQCPVCGMVGYYRSSSRGRFSRRDLGNIDFQNLDLCIGDDGQEFRLQAVGTIISNRVLKILREMKAKGLTRYLTFPPVQFGAVEFVV